MKDLDSVLVKLYHELDKKLELVSSKQDDMQESLQSIDKTLVENTLQLEIHIRGVQALEKANDNFREEHELFKARLLEAEKPKIVITGLLWLVGSLTALGGLYLLIREIF